MKLVLVLDDGTVFDEIPDVDHFDLARPLARSVLLDTIQLMLERAKGDTR
jgi:hypothetical protein